MKPIIPLLLAVMSWNAAASNLEDSAKILLLGAMEENLTIANWDAPPELPHTIEVSTKTMDPGSLECNEVVLKEMPKILCTIMAKPEASATYGIKGLYFVFSFDAETVERVHVIPLKN